MSTDLDGRLALPEDPVPKLEFPSLLPGALLGNSVVAGGPPPRRSGQDWFVDVTAFILSVGVGALLIATNPDRDTIGPVFHAFDIAAGLLSCLALWWRRRWPVQIAVITAVFSVFSVTTAIAGTIMLFTVAVHRPARTVAGVTVLNLVAAYLFMLVRPDPTTPWGVTAVISALLVTGTVAWGMFVRARRQLVMSLRERAERAEAEQHLRVDQARQHERARIAREMHDVLAHRISLLSLHAGALEFRPDAPPNEVARAAGVIRASAHDALEDLRTVIGVLREGGSEEPEPP